MAGNVGGVQEGGAAGTKRPAGNDLGNGNTKRANTRETAAKRTIVPVDDLLNVDFRGLAKLCHRHDRQVGDLGNPFQAVERWARRALPKAQWDSDKHVGHWMRSKNLGVVYMFKNGYCYDNGREFITVPVYGRWLEYIGFKHFKSDEGPEWYTILNATRPGFKTGNPERPNLDVGSWTMSRFGKPVIVGKDNNFYQSVLDAFRERNQAKITDDQEIEVPIKFLTMSNELELEPPRPHQLKMQEYGPYLRVLGESQKQTAPQQPTESHEVTVGESKRGETTHNVTPETGKPKEETPIVESQQTNTSPNVQLPPNPKTPKKPRETSTKISQGLTTPGSEKLTSEAVNKRKSPRGTQTPTGKTTEKAPVATGTLSQPNPGLRTPKEEQKTTSPTPATTTPGVVDTKVPAPTSSQRTGTGYIPESIGFSTYSNNRPRGSTGLVFGSKVPVPTGTQVQQPGTTGSLLNAKVAQNKGNTTGVTSSNAKTEAQAIAESRAIIEAQLAAELKTQRAATTAMQLDDKGVFMTQSGTGSQAPIKGQAIAQAAIIDSSYQPFSVAAKQAFKHFVENEADKDTDNLDDEVNTGIQNPPKDPSKGKREELHGQSQRLSFGVEFEFVMPVVLEEWLDGSDIDEELLPALNVIPLDLDSPLPRKNFDVEENSLAEFHMRRNWVDKQILATLIDLGVPVVDNSTMDNILRNADPKAENISSDRAYWGWKTINDDSVGIPNAVRAAYSSRKTRWVGVELVSPAYWATPKNLGEVRRVIGGLSNKLRFVTPETSGLHVHVGRGKSSFSLAELKRLAGLCYAAGPLVSQLHPAHRRLNLYCKSNRFYSNVAYSLATETAIARRELHRATCNVGHKGGIPQEPLANPQRLGEATKESAQRPADTPRFKRAIKRGGLPREVLSQEEYNDPFYPMHIREEIEKPSPPRAIDSAIDELWRAPTATDLVALFQDFEDRFYAYNFARYVCEDYVGNLDSVSSYFAGVRSRSSSSDGSRPRSGSTGSDESVYGCGTVSANGQHECNTSSRTVEFRQAASTLDPDSVVAWIRVVVNLTCVAVHTTHEEYARLVHCCVKAEREPEWYDAFDLLVDLDMPRTAQFIQNRMLSRATRTPWAALPPKALERKKDEDNKEGAEKEG